jgi:hypothetical protein
MSEPAARSESNEGSATERIDGVVGDTERTAEELAERLGRWIARTAARAREDAEDIWADAQALRRKL